MHNLFLGTSKHLFHLWIEKDIQSKEKVAEIDHRIALFQVPTGVGRLPGHTGSQYGGYTYCQTVEELDNDLLSSGVERLASK